MRNMSPTKIKVLTVTAERIIDADVTMEATFQQWSKDNPMINITQIERSQSLETAILNDEGLAIPARESVHSQFWTVSLTIMYDLLEQAEGVKALLYSTDSVVNAWRNYLASVHAHQEKGGDATQLDMRIAMSGPLAQLELCFRQVREW